MYTGPRGVLTGTARYTQEAEEKADKLLRKQEIEIKQRELERKRKAMEAKIAVMQADFEAEQEEIMKEISEATIREEVLGKDLTKMSDLRGKDK